MPRFLPDRQAYCCLRSKQRAFTSQQSGTNTERLNDFYLPFQTSNTSFHLTNIFSSFTRGQDPVCVQMITMAERRRPRRRPRRGSPLQPVRLLLTSLLLMMLMTGAAFADEHAVAEDKDTGNNGFDDFLTAGDDDDDGDGHSGLDRRLVDEVTRILESTFAQASGSVSVSGDLKDKDFKDGRHFEDGLTTTTTADQDLDPENFEASFPDRPLQLVRPDAQHKGLVLVEENLRLLHAIRQPVSTVAVVGKYHSGKSFLLNQIMAKEAGFGHSRHHHRGEEGFGVGSAVDPQTMGIWVWGRPMKIEREGEGTGKPAGPPQWVLLLDTEGFAATNVSENYDAKIFAVATLLSAQLLYNSVKIIDQSDIDYLELLARRTQLFALKAQMTPLEPTAAVNASNSDSKRRKTHGGDWTAEDAFSPHLLDFPKLIWVIQDFVQKTTQSELDQEEGGNDDNVDNVPASSSSCRHWLLRLLSTHAREAEAYAISLKDIFPAVDCHTLFLPSVRRAHLADLSTATEADLTEEYRAERDALLEKLRQGAVPKRLKKHLGPRRRRMTGEDEVDEEEGGEEFTGTELAVLLRVLVGAANAGSLTDIPNRWDAFLEQLQKSAVEDCYRFYQAHLASLLSSGVAVVKSGGGGGGPGSPVNERRLAAWHTVSADKANALLAHLLHGLPTSLQSSRPELADHLARYYASVSELNRQRLHLRLHALQKEGEMKVVDAFLATPLPLLQRQLQAQADVLLAQVSAQFVADVGDLVDREEEEVDEKGKKRSKKAEAVDDPLRPYLSSLEKAVRLNLDSTLLRNGLQLEALFENATAALLQTAFTEVSIDLVRPPKREAFEALLRRSAELTTAAYGRQMAAYAEERPLYAAKEAKLKLSLLERAQALREDNEAAVSAHLKSEAGKLVHEFERLTAATRRHFPMDADELAAVLAAETDKFRRLFADDLRPRYGSYGALFEEVEALLAEDLQTVATKRAEENFAAFKEEVEQPLALAKRSVLLSSSRYGTLFSWRRFVVSSALLQLEQGRARGWSPSLKAAIIESWMREDAELAREAANRRNVLSRLLGFFQWLLSLLFG